MPDYFSRVPPWYFLVVGIAALTFLLAVLFIEFRVARISRKLDRITIRLEQANRMLSEQTMCLQTIAGSVEPKTVPAPVGVGRVRTDPARPRRDQEVPVGRPDGEPGDRGPFEL